MKEKRVLIVDDEPRVALALSRALEHPLGGEYKVEISPVAETALVKLKNKQYDLIITDLRMPGMGGMDFIRQVRQVCPQARMMLITAYGTPEIQDVAHSLGASYMSKPFGLQEFITAVTGLLKEAEQKNIAASNGRADE